MKSVFKLGAGLLLALFFYSVLVNAGTSVALAAGVVIASLFVSAPKGAALLGINVTQLVAELGQYLKTQNKEIREMVYQKPQAAKYMKTISKVKGEFPVTHSIIGHVVQGFQSVWNAIGEVKIKANTLRTYRQKVNFEFVPDDVHNSWVGELYVEGMKPADMPISKYIVEKQLKPRVVSDIEYLLGNGEYDAGQLSTFGKSMNGIKKVLTDGLADTENPMYGVQVPAMTDDNVVDIFDRFEEAIPVTIASMVDKIYCATIVKNKFRKDYRNTYGGHNDYTKDGSLRTYFGNREIIGLDCLNGSNVLFATPDDNFLKLIDVIDNPPTITDVQVLDYKVKIFMEWSLGVGFWINQLVIVSKTTAGSGIGADTDLYYTN